MPWRARKAWRLESRRERLRRLWRRATGRSWVKSQRVWAVRLGGAGGVTLKRIEFASAAEADRVERQLEAAQRSGVTPRAIARDGSELWVEYLEGDPVRPGEFGSVGELADLLAPLWRLGPQPIDPHASGFAAALLRNLEFLANAGILEARRARELQQCAKEWEPAALWWGMDYSDLRPQNLIRMRNGRLAIVDVESLGDAHPLGTGIAKACLPRVGWLAAQRDPLLAALAERGLPDVRPAFPYVALAQLAGWQKRCALRGKRHSIDPTLFDSLRPVRSE